MVGRFTYARFQVQLKRSKEPDDDAASLIEARQLIMMVKMAGDLDDLLSNAELMGTISKAKLLK